MKKAWRWLGVLIVAGFVMAGTMTALAEVPHGHEPKVRFVNPEEFGDNSGNSSGKSAVKDGSGGAQPASADAVDSGIGSKSGGFWGWLGDHGMGLVKGIGAGLIGAAVVAGVAALVVGAGAPLLIMAGAAVLGGAIYGAPSEARTSTGPKQLSARLSAASAQVWVAGSPARAVRS